MKNSILYKIVQIAKPYKKQIFFVIFLAIIINILQLINPYLFKIVIDDYLSLGILTKSGISITIIGILYIGISVLSNLIDMLARCITDNVGEKIVYDMRNRLFKFIEYANISFHDKISTGKLFVRITNDADDISILFKDVISTVVKDILMVIAIIAMLVYINAKLSALSLIIVPFIIIFSYVVTTTLNKIYTIAKSIKTKLNTFIAESIYGLKLIKVFNRQKEKEEECEKYANDFYNSRKLVGIYEGLLPAVMDILSYLGISIIVVTCTNKWFGIQLEVGVIYVFVTYLTKLFDPIIRIIENIEVVQDAIVSINKIYEILDKEYCLEDIDSGKYVSDFKGKIEFKNVWFSYDKENYILKDVSFVINPHESVALVGKTGSGKTTITNLINRFYEIDKGEILIDGINIKDINLRSLRKNVGTILQDPFIFARSIKENVKISSDISAKVIESSIRLSSANTFVDKLPQKSEYIARERGSNFSVGEKQLLSFARIFAHNPSIFILDEATANIDTHTENMIQKSVDMISKEKTSIFIAHRLSTIVNVDKIFVLDKGKIIETGNHSELLKQGGYYSKLYESYYESLSN